MQKQIETKKISKEDAEKMIEVPETFSSPTMLKILGSLGAIAGSFGWLFFISLVIWILGRYLFKAEFSYMKTVEVCGLASMISVLAGIISMLLVVVTGNMFMTPGPALLIREFDPTNKAHLLLAAINLMTLWS